MPSNTRADASTQPLPSGTLTFLLTDIEGSTRMWEAAPEAMRSALARHDEIVHQGVETHAGHVFKAAGDAFFAAFTTPWLALNAALAMQHALQAEAWPAQSPIRVRMALHTGAAELRNGDYFGTTLNQAARMLATGHGGQTLVSSVTQELCNDRLPAGVVLKSLGEHLLKDVVSRQIIYQLVHPSLPQTFAPLRTLLAPLDTSVPSIAVLPFVNRSHDKEDEYFSDGLSDELLNVLAKIRGLRVAARSSAFTFKGATATVAEVGQALNVATVLEGSVRKSGNRMRISVQLVQVADGYQLWSESYDRTLEDIFAVQDDIAQTVVQELRGTLLGEPAGAKVATDLTAQLAGAVAGRATDPEAHRLLLQARHLIERITRDDTAMGILYLEQALEREPQFALAWAELSGAYASQADRSWVTAADGYGRAREAADRALALEPALAEGHAILGWIQFSHDLDLRAAAASYARALELAPGNVLVLRRFCALANTLGQFDEAIRVGRRVVEQDPLNAVAYNNLGLALDATDRLPEAENAYRKAIELGPQRTITRAVLAVNLLKQGRGEEALAEALREPEEWGRLYASAIICHAIGHSVEADTALRDLIAKHGEEDAVQVAEVYAARGEPDPAFAWLERAYVQRDPGLTDLKSRNYFRALHADARWDALLREMGLDFGNALTLHADLSA
jgi:TolB-like protein/class 3 adenylate cyclase/Flp pilus assembly protein TadD